MTPPVLLQSGNNTTAPGAPSGESGGGISEGVSDGVISALTDRVIDSINEQIADFEFIDQIFEFVLTTPTPLNDADSFVYFTAPDGGIWADLYDPLYTNIQLLTATLFTLVLGLAMFTAIFNDRAERKRTMRKVILHLPLAYFWWWFAGLFLKLNHELTMALLNLGNTGTQDGMVNNITDLLSLGGTAGVFGTILYVVGGLVVIILAAVYITRYVAIHIYVVGGPILLMLSAVPIDGISGWADNLLQSFFPLVMMTLPVSLLLSVGFEILP
jgi:hypothetical protein